jgi:hypothetical protein
MHDLYHDVMFFVITISVLVLYLTFQVWGVGGREYQGSVPDQRGRAELHLCAPSYASS